MSHSPHALWKGFDVYATCSVCGITHHKAELAEGRCTDALRCARGAERLPFGGLRWEGKRPEVDDSKFTYISYGKSKANRGVK